ncbi:MAG: hypothetical protein IPL40_08885 [Proteobacteria bacterium]|nr:hypothetical protein [Pseudomonadota bacterium]
MSERSSKPKPPPHDVVLVHGRTADGRGVRALRSRPNRLELAELRVAKEGQPLHPGGELVQLKRREESPLLWDVDVKWRGEEAAAAAAPSSGPEVTGHAGPAQVATDRYRENWEAIFGLAPGGRRPPDGGSLN